MSETSLIKVVQKPKLPKEMDERLIPGKLYLANSNQILLWNNGVAKCARTTDVLLLLKLKLMDKGYTELSFLFHGIIYKSYILKHGVNRNKDYWYGKIIELQ